MRLKRSMLAFVCIAALIVSTSTVFATGNHSENSQAQAFKDVSTDHWAYHAINEMVKRRVIEGDGNGVFNPDAKVTRAQFSKMMVLVLNLSLKNPGQSSFKDLKEGSWQYQYVETAKYYLTGFRTSAGDYFKPDEPAVREDMAVALVKALKYDISKTNENILDTYYDSQAISPNLKKYVAEAVNQGIMEGSTLKGSKQKAFAPQDALTRASAASLLFNLISKDKVTYEQDEKVTYNDNDAVEETENEDTNYDKVNVTGKIENGKLVLRWTKINDNRFQGYKVVISKNNPYPSYPDDGYLYYITDKNQTTAVVDNSSSYNGGDFSGHLQKGQKYYFSITVLYNDIKLPGNVIQLTYPGDKKENNTTPEHPSSTLSGKISGGKIILNWSKIYSEDFQGYKVVISNRNSKPKYPDEGYLYYITDRNQNSATVDSEDQYNGGDFNGRLIPGESYYFSITVLYPDQKVAGNVIRLTCP